LIRAGLLFERNLVVSVLGIDAAWTLTQPSGVALVSKTSAGWALVAADSSYDAFYVRANGHQPAVETFAGSKPDAARLLETCDSLTGHLPEIIAIDMPLSHAPIDGRRVSDNAVSSAYGGKKKCGTHTPSTVRPGAISDTLTADFAAAGYPLRTSEWTGRGIIEVYPHPALLELARAKERLPYKASKQGAYWPDLSVEARRERLFAEWAKIVALLEAKISGVAEAFPPLPQGSTGKTRKAYEDRLDAVVCAWIAICVFEGKARAFGDEVSAIWVPLPE
jgi:predicted RNase H-like nuclease